MKAALTQLQQTLQHNLQMVWQARSPRERLGLGLAGGLITLALVWEVGLAPALHTLNEAQGRQSALDAQRKRLLQLQQQAQALQALPRIGREEAVRWLEGPASELLGPGAQVRVQGDQVQVQLQAAPPQGLSRWLREAREQARAMPQQVQLQQANPAAGTPHPSATGNRPAGNGEAGAPEAGLRWKGSLVLKLS